MRSEDVHIGIIFRRGGKKMRWTVCHNFYAYHKYIIHNFIRYIIMYMPRQQSLFTLHSIGNEACEGGGGDGYIS